VREGLGLERLEVRATDLRAAEACSARHRGIADVQRFGDRLDVMVRDVARASGRSARRWRAPVRRPRCAGGAHARERVRRRSCATSRASARPRFPATGTQARRAGAVAIGARGLGKSFGASTR
jgi:ABC-2 type transport system ATP-binding protein